MSTGPRTAQDCGRDRMVIARSPFLIQVSDGLWPCGGAVETMCGSAMAH